MPDIRSGQDIPKQGKELHVPGLRVIEPVNDFFVAAVDYYYHRLRKKSSCNDDDVAHKLHKVA